MYPKRKRLGPYATRIEADTMPDELFGTLEYIWIGIGVAAFTASVQRRLHFVLNVYK